MSDPRPTCPTCGKRDKVFEDENKKGKTASRFWRCLRCDTPIRKPRL